jgi:predicted transcriptional regulator
LENPLAAAACEVFELLKGDERTELVRLFKEFGYSSREIAEIMGVSPPAISRYLKGTLTPSTDTLCRLASRVSSDELVRLLAAALERVWARLRSVLETLAESDAQSAVKLLEMIADDIARILASVRERGIPSPPQDPRYP